MNKRSTASIVIKSLQNATFDEWDNIWKNCDYATYFQSREWAEIWQIYTNGQIYPDPLLVTFSDGKKALLPFSSQKIYRGLFKKYISSPAGTFGGWITNENLTLDHTLLLGNYLQKQIGNLFWRINPYTPHIEKIQLIYSKDDQTDVLNLQDGFEAIYKSWTRGDSSTARKARKARKEGVSIKIASTPEEWLIYYQVYQDSLLRWGKDNSSGYQWRLFEEIFQRKSPNIKLWLAIYQDQIIAGALIFYAKRHVVYWHGAALEKYFKLRPVNLLMCEIIKNSCEGGYAWFDFNPSGGHEGVKAFKKSFGAEEIPCSVYSSNSKTINFLKKIRL